MRIVVTKAGMDILKGIAGCTQRTIYGYDFPGYLTWICLLPAQDVEGFPGTCRNLGGSASLNELG